MPEMNVVPAVHADGDELWLDADGDFQYRSRVSDRPPEAGWRRLYVEPKTEPIDRAAVQRLAEALDGIAERSTGLYEMATLDAVRAIRKLLK